MSKHRDDVSPKVFKGVNPGIHFDPYFDKQKSDREAHERGQEHKIRKAMGERRKVREHSVHEIQAISTRKAAVTLASLKWGSDK